MFLLAASSQTNNKTLQCPQLDCRGGIGIRVQKKRVVRQGKFFGAKSKRVDLEQEEEEEEETEGGILAPCSMVPWMDSCTFRTFERWARER